MRRVLAVWHGYSSGRYNSLGATAVERQSNIATAFLGGNVTPRKRSANVIWRAGGRGHGRPKADTHGQRAGPGNSCEFFQAFPVVENSPPRGPRRTSTLAKRNRCWIPYRDVAV